MLLFAVFELIHNDPSVTFRKESGKGFLTCSKKVKVLPLSIGEAKGIPVYASCNVTIPPGAQVIHNTGLLLALPAGTHGEIFGIPNASRLEPWVAPGILMPSEKEVLILLAN
ncbi:hypothetical protein DSO57_1011297 [Entomophthora muscae]|uniref:Uncharacterized protein n=1 Tax=Entomophthora muscae TaxID=34485 RepID=A0ACC2SJ32_9FUNG|nr:hypothetical protein DSO57_1011297 [Entomophthora muscae]